VQTLNKRRDAQRHRAAGEADQPAFAVSHLSHTYAATHSTPDRQVLRDVDLTAQAGEFTVVVGRSGCGKTTLLNILAGLIPAQGDVHVLGTTPEAARQRMSYMLARDALLPWRSARKNVEFPLEVRGIDRETRHQRAVEYLTLVGLEQSLDLHPWQLSQGMRQRVALARTWALEPDLLLMDEPFASVDAQTRLLLQSELLRLWERQRTSVLFITHDLNEAIALADRIIVMREGIVAHDIRVPFERPRELETLPFADGYKELWTTLNDSLR
jgi:NitT/TauT family transport system ATP-binding protein